MKFAFLLFGCKVRSQDVADFVRDLENSLSLTETSQIKYRNRWKCV